MKTEKKKTDIRPSFILRSALYLTIVAGIFILSFPYIFSVTSSWEQKLSSRSMEEQFPVTVDPRNRVIAEDARVNAYLASPSSPLAAAVGGAGSMLGEIFGWLASSISDAPWYQSLASVEGRVVTIVPGLRKEQVAAAFGKALSWNRAQEKQFLTAAASSSLPLAEGSFSPGVYLVRSGMTPAEAQALVNERFTSDVLEHYGTTTAAKVPLTDAIIIASLIQRETIGTDDMRLVSGIIWNRLFSGMNLQIDATVQYAKANTRATASWWPRVMPRDIHRSSPYNTYVNPGLPPTPIANPSVAAVLAALNPIKTSCYFYFHDADGDMHCSATYAEHVTLLKEYYGRGK